MIYYIQPKAGGLVKIGHSINVDHRLATLQASSPLELVVRSTEHGGYQREAELHWQFRDLREHGEWFRPHPYMPGVILDRYERRERLLDRICDPED
jgi:hypothetical protein